MFPEQSALRHLILLHSHRPLPPFRLHRVAHLIPTLNWKPEDGIGVRLQIEPRDEEELRSIYKEIRESSCKTMEAASQSSPTERNMTCSDFSLWPASLTDFMKREFHRHFIVNAYLLDPAQVETPYKGIAQPQHFPNDAVAIEGNPFRGVPCSAWRRAKAICSSVYLDLFTTKSSDFLIVDFARKLTLSVDLFHGCRSVDEKVSRRKAWPDSPAVLGRLATRSQAFLRKSGINIERQTGGNRIITISKDSVEPIASPSVDISIGDLFS